MLMEGFKEILAMAEPTIPKKKSDLTE